MALQTPTLDIPDLAAQSPLLGRPVLLATDGTPGSAGAVQVAARLAEAGRVSLQAIAVLEALPYPIPTMDPSVAVAAEAFTVQELRDKLGRTVRAQLLELLGPTAPEPAIVDGPVVATLEREAERRDAGLLVLGLRPHDRIDRLVRDETTLRVVRSATLPVLAVVPSRADRPRTVVAALDFSRASVRATRDVAALLEPGSTLILAHVRPPADLNAEDADGYGIIYEQGVRGALARLQESLQVPAGVRVETARLEGEPAPGLMAFARERGADCIALGSHRHSFVSRMLLGSVAQDLLRAAQISLFIAPPER